MLIISRINNINAIKQKCHTLFFSNGTGLTIHFNGQRTFHDTSNKSVPGSLLVGWAQLKQQVQIAKGVYMISIGGTTPGDSCLALH